jgi:hypothetical protein
MAQVKTQQESLHAADWPVSTCIYQGLTPTPIITFHDDPEAKVTRDQMDKQQIQQSKIGRPNGIRA